MEEALVSARHRVSALKESTTHSKSSASFSSSEHEAGSSAVLSYPQRALEVLQIEDSAVKADFLILGGQALDPDPFLADPDIIDRLPSHKAQGADVEEPQLQPEQAARLVEDMKAQLDKKVNSGIISTRELEKVLLAGTKFIRG